jgi:hypothetical protein
MKCIRIKSLLFLIGVLHSEEWKRRSKSESYEMSLTANRDNTILTVL